MRASTDFKDYLEGSGDLPEGARVPIVAGKASLLPEEQPFFLNAKPVRLQTPSHGNLDMSICLSPAIHDEELFNMLSKSLIVMADIGKPLDIQGLWREVQAVGGYQQCTSGNKWIQIARNLGIDTGISTNASYLLRSANSCLYSKYFLNYFHT